MKTVRPFVPRYCLSNGFVASCNTIRVYSGQAGKRKVYIRIRSQPIISPEVGSLPMAFQQQKAVSVPVLCIGGLGKRITKKPVRELHDKHGNGRL